MRCFWITICLIIKLALISYCCSANVQFAASVQGGKVRAESRSLINVVFVYGAGSSPETFDTIRCKFPSESFNLYFFDPVLPVLSAEDRKSLPLSYWADELEAFLVRSGLDQVHFIAHSFGARVVARFVEEKGDARVKSLVIEDIDFEARVEASHDPLAPLNYSAAVEDQRDIVSRFTFPTLVLGAEKKSGITSAGEAFFRTLCIEKPNINLINILGSSHSIHKSSPRSFMIEVFDFYFRFGFFLPQQIKTASLRFVKNMIDDTMRFLSVDQLTEWDQALSFHVCISTITSLHTLSTQLQGIWKSSLSKESKLQCTAFYEKRSQLILWMIYSHEARQAQGEGEMTQLEWVLLTKGMIKIPTVNYLEDPEPSKDIEFFGQQVLLDVALNRASKTYHLDYLLISLKQIGIEDRFGVRIKHVGDSIDEKKTVLLLKIGD